MEPIKNARARHGDDRHDDPSMEPGWSPTHASSQNRRNCGNRPSRSQPLLPCYTILSSPSWAFRGWERIDWGFHPSLVKGKHFLDINFSLVGHSNLTTAFSGWRRGVPGREKKKEKKNLQEVASEEQRRTTTPGPQGLVTAAHGASSEAKRYNPCPAQHSSVPSAP